MQYTLTLLVKAGVKNFNNYETYRIFPSNEEEDVFHVNNVKILIMKWSKVKALKLKRMMRLIASVMLEMLLMMRRMWRLGENIGDVQLRNSRLYPPPPLSLPSPYYHHHHHHQHSIIILLFILIFIIHFNHVRHYHYGIIITIYHYFPLQVCVKRLRDTIAK